MAESPPAEELVTSVTDDIAPTPDTPAEPAESAPAKPASMLEAVQAAVKPREAPPASEPEAVAADGATPDQPKGEEDDELTAEETAKLSSKTQRRIRKLDRAAKEAEAQISAIRPRAEEYDKIENFVRQTGLTNEAVAGTLMIAALMRHNPREALNRLAPIYQQLSEMVGESLPSELQQRVQQGYLTEADARAIARSSAEAAINARRAEEANQRYWQENQAREQRQVVDSTIGSVETWEATKARTDPDWNSKRDEIAEQVELSILKESHRRGQPWFPSAQEAIQLSEDALKNVNQRFKRFAPRPTAVNPTASGGASQGTKAAPKSMLDVVRQTVGAA